MVRFIGMVGQPRRNFTKMASWSRTSEHLVNPIGMSDQLKWNNQQDLMKTLSEKGFNGTVQCCNGEYYSDVFKLGSIPNIKVIEKCDNE